MDLEQLGKIENLSVRCYNICRTSGLNTIDLILNWYNKYGGFKNIRNCGKDTSQELVVVCLKYIDRDRVVNQNNVQLSVGLELVDSDIIDNQKLVQRDVGLKLENAISIRAYNVCLYNELSTFESLRQYYKMHGTFSKFRNCGLKTNKELIDFCKANIDSVSKDEQLQEPFLIENFNKLQKRVIRYYGFLLWNDLPRDIYRPFRDFLGGVGSFSMENVFDKVINNAAFELRRFDFLGDSSIEKLADIIKSYKATVKSVSKISGKEELINYNFKVTLNYVFPYSSLYDKLRVNSIFCAMQCAIENGLLFDKNILKVFKNKFKIYKNNSIGFQDENIDLSKERVRQIVKIIQDSIYKKSCFVKRLIDDTLAEFNLFSDSDMIFIDQLLNEEINAVNQTDFSKEWNSYLVYVYFGHSFELIGNLEDVLLINNKNSKVRHKWSCFYIVNNDFTDVFDFLVLVSDFKLSLDSFRSKSEYFNINSYVSEKLSNSNSNDILRIVKIARFIIMNEFGLEFDENDNFLLQKNARKPLHECAYSALSAIGSPASVSDITSMVAKLFPEELTTENKVRASLKRKFGFVPIGRSSVFGLANWENELLNFKGGTIRSLVCDYLKMEGSPRHIDSITDFVRKYRPNTYRRSVWDNLRTDASGVFVFSNDRFVGLKSIISNESNQLLNEFLPEKVKTWEQSFSVFVDFISDNSRLPRSSGCPIEEIQLYRWYSIQIRSLDRGELDIGKSNQLQNIADEFPINGPRKRSSITKDIEEYESVIFEILRECPGQIATKESLNAELVNILKLDSQLVDKIINNAAYLERRLCLAGRPFYYYHTSSDILDISRDNDNIQDFILTNLRTAEFRLEYYYKAMRKMIETPDPEIITGAISRLISLKKISQFYHKFIDMDSEILLPNRLRAILDNLIMGICESMANRRDTSFMMDRDVYNNKFVNDFVSYLTISGVVKLVFYEIKIEIVYLINYNGDKVILTNNIEALFLPFVLKNYFVGNKIKCEFMVLGFNVKYIYRYNLISYE